MKFNLLIAIVSFSITLLLSELVLRHTIVPLENDVGNGPIIEKDRQLGYRMRPNQNTVMSNGHFSVSVITSKDGHRDVYENSYPDKGVVAIGDSQTFGHGIEAVDSWPEQLQEQMKTNVLNTGVMGYAPFQYQHVIRRLHDQGMEINLVLYAMSWNDAIFLRESNVVSMTGLTDDIEKKTHSVDFTTRIRKTAMYGYITEKTAFGRLLSDGLRNFVSMVGASTTPHEDESLKDDMLGVMDEILELNAFLDEIGASLVIVHVAHANFVMPDVWTSYNRRHNYSQYIVREQFSPWAKKNNIIFVDAIDDLERRYITSGNKRTSIILPVNAHYNQSGHEVIAEIFFRTLRSNGLLELEENL